MLFAVNIFDFVIFMFIICSIIVLTKCLIDAVLTALINSCCVILMM